MQYREYPPNKLLARHVKCIWILENIERKTDHPTERVFPDGCMEMLFHFGDFFEHHLNDGRVQRQPRCFVVGQIRRFMLLRPTGRIGVIGVRFRPAGAYPFFGIPMHELTERTLTLDLVWGKFQREIEERVLEAKTA
jgi:hypothetical protein